jgi:hypothetical protein
MADDIWTRSLVTAAGLSLAYLTGLVFYRLFLHPLAKLPGPWYAGISHWHEFYYEIVLKGQFTFKTQELHRQYGET